MYSLPSDWKAAGSSGGNARCRGAGVGGGGFLCCSQATQDADRPAGRRARARAACAPLAGQRTKVHARQERVADLLEDVGLRL
eukprot:1772386-Prymnesium_polylepis.1